MNIIKFLIFLLLSSHGFGKDFFGSTDLNNPISIALEKGIPVLVKFEMSRACPPCTVLDNIFKKNIDESRMAVASLDLFNLRKIEIKSTKNCSIYNKFGQVDTDANLYSKFYNCLYKTVGTPAYFFLDPNADSVIGLNGNNLKNYKYLDMVKEVVNDSFNQNEMQSMLDVVDLIKQMYDLDDLSNKVKLEDVYYKMENPREGKVEVKKNITLIDAQNELRNFESRLKDQEANLKFRESQISFSERLLKKKEEAYEKNLKLLNKRTDEVLERENEVDKLRLKYENAMKND